MRQFAMAAIVAIEERWCYAATGFKAKQLQLPQHGHLRLCMPATAPGAQGHTTQIPKHLTRFGPSL